MPNIEQEGRFKGQPFQWGLKESNSEGSQSVALPLKVMIYEQFDESTGSWIDIRDKNLEAYGEIWFILRTGEVDDTKLQILMTTLNWDGDAAKLVIPVGSPGAIVPPVIVFKVKKNDYKGDTQFKIDSIGNSFGFIPKIGGAKAKSLADRINERMKPAPPADPDGSVPF
jgi:hypothetical protein